MKRKTVVLLSSILAASALIGGVFAVYAVTDNANPLNVDIRISGEIVTPVTLDWGEGTTTDVTLDELVPGKTYKAATVILKSNIPYTGQLDISLSDKTLGKETNVYLVDFIKAYLYEGQDGEVGERELPTTGLVATKGISTRNLTYKSADGSPEGNPYSLYIEIDTAAYNYYYSIQYDLGNISIDWNELVPEDHSVPPTEGYALKVVRGSETSYYAAEDTGEVSYGKNVYRTEAIALEAGDSIYMYDGSTGASFNCAGADKLYLETPNTFVYHDEYVSVSVSDTYIVELQLAFEDNSYYIHK